MRILSNADILQVNGKAEGMKIQRTDTHRVTLQVCIHLPLDIAAQGFIDDEANGDGRPDQDHDPSRQPDPEFPHRHPSCSVLLSYVPPGRRPHRGARRRTQAMRGR
jgi:hypothetical protein